MDADVEQVQQVIEDTTARFKNTQSSSSSTSSSSTTSNPLSHFRTRIVPNLELNAFDQPISSLKLTPTECDQMIDLALKSKDFDMFKEILWLIRDENDQNIRRTMIKTYIRVCCLLTDDALNDAVDQLLDYLHHDNDETWRHDLRFIFDLLHQSGLNVEKIISLMEDLKISDILNEVELTAKFNYDDRAIENLSNTRVIQTIRRVFRIILSLEYFQVEKLKSSLSDDHHLFLFLLGFYFQLDKRFQDVNTIHLARRLMVNALISLDGSYWNGKRDLVVECLYKLSAKNVYITELFLKTNERTVQLRTQLAFLHVKRLVNMIEHEKKPEATILQEIIQLKLDPRRFDRPIDFIDCVRLLDDIIDSYPYEQQIEFLSKLYTKILPYVAQTHERILTDEQRLVLFDDCARWETMLKPVFNRDDFEKLNKRK